MEQSSTRTFVGKRIRRGWSVNAVLGLETFSSSAISTAIAIVLLEKNYCEHWQDQFSGLRGRRSPSVRFRRNFPWTERCRSIRGLDPRRHWPLVCPPSRETSMEGECFGGFTSRFLLNFSNGIFVTVFSTLVASNEQGF